MIHANGSVKYYVDGGPARLRSKRYRCPMPPTADSGQRPVLIAYDGSRQAKGAIVEASRELGTGRSAVVLTVYEMSRSTKLPSPE